MSSVLRSGVDYFEQNMCSDYALKCSMSIRAAGVYLCFPQQHIFPCQNEGLVLQVSITAKHQHSPSRSMLDMPPFVCARCETHSAMHEAQLPVSGFHCGKAWVKGALGFLDDADQPIAGVVDCKGCAGQCFHMGASKCGCALLDMSYMSAAVCHVMSYN